MAKENEILNELVNRSVLGLTDVANVNTMIGKPIVTASGFQIIPFSKVTLGSVVGGGEYGNEKIAKEMLDLPFAGGNGTVVTMKPLGFIIDDGKSCQILRVTDDPMDNLIERASEIIKNVTEKA